MKIGALVPCLNEWRFMPAVLGQLQKVADRAVVLRNRTAHSGVGASLLPAPPLDPRVEVVEGSWWDESTARNAGMDLLADCDYVLTLDSDEVLSDDALFGVLDLVDQAPEGTYRAVVLPLRTYWKTTRFAVECASQSENLAPVLLRRDVRHLRHRLLEPGDVTMLSHEVLHHLSFVRTDEEMRDKLRLSGHAAEVVPGWYERVWLAWDRDPLLRGIHPTHPDRYVRAVPVEDPDFEALLAEHGCAVVE